MKVKLTIFLIILVATPALIASETVHSRKVELENDWIRITVDERTGAVLKCLNRKTGTEYLADRSDPKPPFVIDTYSANQAVYIRDPFEQQSGGFSLFRAEKSAEVRGDLTHAREAITNGVHISTSRTQTASKLECACLLPHGLAVTYSITLPHDSPFTEWRIQIENRGGETPAHDLRVYRVAFPFIEGLRIGAHHESNLLARPYAQGELIQDPASYEFLRPKYPVPINVLTYPGWASMPWQDLYADSAGGFYLASHDPAFQQLDLECWPDKQAGTIALGMRTLAFLEPGHSWKSQSFEIAVHEGDWHWGADRYREWAQAHHKKFDGPKWVQQESDGWLGTGVPTRRYNDYLKMFEDAQWLGLNYLQIWSEMLENVGPNKSRKPYYCFLWPDPERGGEEELRNVVQAIRSGGGHVGFYHNLWTWDSELAKGLEQWRDKLPPDVHVPGWWGESRRWASVFPDGSRLAGNFTQGYAGMCPAAEPYQDYILSWVVDRYVKRYGADTWYFDSMPVTMFAASRICFSDEHGPAQPHGVGHGMLRLLQRVREATASSGGLAITSETVNDALMQYNSHALGLELIDGITRYPKPEIYTYTFPEHPIFSGTCNGAGSGLKYYYPDLKEPRRVDTMNRVFLMGYRFDILMGGLNRADPFTQYLKRLIRLRQQTKADLYASEFRDEIGLSALPEKLYAKIFRRLDRSSIVVNVVDRRQEHAPFELAIELSKHRLTNPKEANLFLLDGEKKQLEFKLSDGKLRIAVPPFAGEAAAIVIPVTPM